MTEMWKKSLMMKEDCFKPSNHLLRLIGGLKMW
jgi:hypothetical protein